jgi:hypothetical protein
MSPDNHQLKAGSVQSLHRTRKVRGRFGSCVHRTRAVPDRQLSRAVAFERHNRAIWSG